MRVSFARSKPSFVSVSMHTSTARSFVYVLLERREATHVGDVEGGRSRLALVAEEPLEPAVAQDRVVAGALVAGLGQLGGELPQRDALLVLVALDRVGDPGEVGRELVLVAQELAPALVELRGRVGLDVAELVAVARSSGMTASFA